MGLVGVIFIVTSLVMFSNLATHDWQDGRRMVLAFVFLGLGAVFCAVEALWDHYQRRGGRR